MTRHPSFGSGFVARSAYGRLEERPEGAHCRGGGTRTGMSAATLPVTGAVLRLARDLDPPDGETILLVAGIKVEPREAGVDAELGVAKILDELVAPVVDDGPD